MLDKTPGVLYDQTDVIGYASWGSNDKNRHDRFTGFQWLPGAIMTEYVSTNARTFVRPPENWTISDWNSPQLWFAGSPQTLTADYIHEGATGASGHVYEPYLAMNPRPDILFPAYYRAATWPTATISRSRALAGKTSWSATRCAPSASREVIW